MATLPTFRTWVAGEIVTAAYMNSNIRDAGNYFLGVPVAELRQTVAQSIPNAIQFTAVLLDTEDLDTDNGHSTVTNTSRYTAQTPGWFRYSGGCAFAAGATGVRVSVWQKNGTVVNGSGVEIDATATLNMLCPARTKHIQMNGSTDFVELGVFQNNGGALNTAVTTYEQANMSVAWVRS